MSRIRVCNPIDRDFGMVPRSLWDASLPFAAKGVAAYLFCLRDGSFPYVAEIEAALGLGRDARRKAFAALEAAGVIEWVIERNARNAIVAKTLVLHPLALHAPESQAHGAFVGSASRAPDNQADGVAALSVSHAPDNPAGGNSTPAAVEINRCNDGISGDLLRERKKERAAAARSSVKPARVIRPVPALSEFQRARVLSGQPVLIDGETVRSGSPRMEALRAALRSQDAENGRNHV